MIRRKHPVVTVPVLPRRRHEIGKPIEELKRRELDDAAGPRPCGLPRATRADPVGGFVPGQHVTDAGDATTRVTSDKRGRTIAAGSILTIGLEYRHETATMSTFPRVARFRTAADLRAHLASLAAPIPLDDEMLSAAGGSPLASPIAIGGFTVGNLYVSSGTGSSNSLISKFDSAGAFQFSWSIPGVSGFLATAPVAVPEPTTSLMAIAALAGVQLLRRQHRRHDA